MPESQLLAHIREAAAVNGWLLYHVHDSRRSEAGFPDVIAVRDGAILALELKGHDARGRLGKATPAQLRWLSALRDGRVVAAVVVTPREWLDNSVLRLLQRGEAAA